MENFRETVSLAQVAFEFPGPETGCGAQWAAGGGAWPLVLNGEIPADCKLRPWWIQLTEFRGWSCGWLPDKRTGWLLEHRSFSGRPASRGGKY